MAVIEYDQATNEALIKLPAVAEGLASALRDDLAAEFAFEGMGLRTIKAMNEYARHWLGARGVDIAPEAEDVK